MASKSARQAGMKAKSCTQVSVHLRTEAVSLCTTFGRESRRIV